ncbi:hypothetical protein OPFAMLBM_00213 [Aeromonas phage avDM12-TAAL]|nr:hypothetical protein OPFAMLBM_00213 [Aeromonas phage avDM12-TAAL]
MSLPSYALFMKNGDCVGSCFINCGWWHDEPRTLKQIIRYTETDECPIDYDSVIAYGVTYSNDLEFELLKAEETEAKLKEIAENKRKQSWEDLHQKMIERMKPIDRMLPELIAAEIYGVQPMNEHVPNVFSLKVVYGDDISC